MNCNLLAALNF